MIKVARILAWVGGGLILAAALLAFDAGTASAVVPRWMAVYAMAAGALVWLLCKRRVRVDLVDMAALAFLGWAALSLLWSPDWRAGLLHWQHMAALFAVALLFRHVKFFDRAIVPALAILVTVAAGLGVWMPEWHGGFGNENFIAETLLIATAFFMAPPHEKVWVSWLTLGAALVVVAYLAFWNGSDVQYAVLLGLMVLGGAFCFVYRYYLFSAVAVATGLVLAGYAALYTTVTERLLGSFMDRAELWLNTLHMIAERPFFGGGFGSFDYLYPRGAHVELLGNQSFMGAPTDFAGAAHNEYLQLWAELGLVGVLLAAVIVGLIIFRGYRYGFLAIFVTAILAFIGFPLQNPASAVVVAIVAGLSARGPCRIRFRAPWVRICGLAVVPLAWSAMLFWVSSVHASNVHRFIAVNPAIAMDQQFRALDVYDLDPWLRMQAMLTLGTVLRTYSQVEMTAAAGDRVYEISRTAGPYHAGMLIVRVEYLINAQRYDDPAVRDEIDGIFATLREHTPFYAQGTALEAAWAGILGDEARLEDAVARTMALPDGRETFRRMGFLKESEHG